MFVERIKRGAFRKSLKRSDLDVPLLVNHEGLPFARTTNGTLRLEEDARGLKIEADVVDTTDGIDLMKRVRRGDLAKMSFAFTVNRDEWRYAKNDGIDERDIIEFRTLNDVSVVVDPAYDATDVEADDTERSYENVSVTTNTTSSNTNLGGTYTYTQGTNTGLGQQRDLGGVDGSSDTEADKQAHEYRAITIRYSVRSK